MLDKLYVYFSPYTIDFLDYDLMVDCVLIKDGKVFMQDKPYIDRVPKERIVEAIKCLNEEF